MSAAHAELRFLATRRTQYFTKWPFEPDLELHLYSDNMATSRDYDEPQSPCPSWIRKIPRHLEDFELSYSTTRQMLPPIMHEEHITASLDSSSSRKQDMEEFRWQRMEECWMGIQHQICELQLTMDESRELNERVQRLEQITSPVHKGTSPMERFATSPLCTSNPVLSEAERSQHIWKIREQAQMTSAPPGLIPDSATCLTPCGTSCW